MDNLMASLLTQHADELVGGRRPDPRRFTRRVPGREAELQVLLDVAVQLQRVFRPASPSAVFRKRLGEELLLAAAQSRLAPTASPVRGPWKYWWLGAAALGSAVAAGGFIAYRARSRNRGPILAKSPVLAKAI